MSVSLVLNCHGLYTNLDYVEGNVHFDISKPEKLHKITVRLQGFHFLCSIFNESGLSTSETLEGEDYSEIHKVKFTNQR